MSEKMMHTPLPWFWNADSYEMMSVAGQSVFWVPGGTYQGEGNIDANAAYIVKAANAYPAFVEALRKITDEGSGPLSDLECVSRYINFRSLARAALAQLDEGK